MGQEGARQRGSPLLPETPLSILLPMNFHLLALSFQECQRCFIWTGTSDGQGAASRKFIGAKARGALDITLSGRLAQENPTRAYGSAASRRVFPPASLCPDASQR
jgi:hypothetical protein